MNVYQNKLDNKYDVVVERIDRDNGILKIIDVNTVLFTEQVKLAWGALFGPDVDDVQRWNEKCIDFVDNVLPTLNKPKEEEDPYRYRHICNRCGQSYSYAGYREEVQHSCGMEGFK